MWKLGSGFNVGEFINNQENLPPEFQRVVDDNFWDLLEGVTISAPWTNAQIGCLQRRQEDSTKHPYTCNVCSEPLTPYRDGWYCDYCHKYKQEWAHRDDCVEPLTHEDIELLTSYLRGEAT